MTCPHCGSTAVRPTGVCGVCGRSINGAQADATALHYPPAVDPFATEAPLIGPEPDPPAPTQPHPPRQAPTQPYPGPSSAPYPEQPHPEQPYPTQPYPGQPPYYGPNPYAAQPSAGQGFSITAFVLAAIAVFFVPIVFGLGAIVFAAAARRRNEQYGQLAMKLAVLGTALGLLFAYVAARVF
jgi:hypothetical protein